MRRRFWRELSQNLRDALCNTIKPKTEVKLMSRRLVFLAVAGMWCFPAYSHHNSTSHYDLSQQIVVEGVVTEFRLINPHARIKFNVTTETGEVEAWLAEGDAASVLLRRGWSGDEMKPGDFIIIKGNPSRDGSPLIEWQLITLSDGTELLGGNGVPVERERALRKLEKLREARRSEESDSN